jgi:ceramide synthetase
VGWVVMCKQPWLWPSNQWWMGLPELLANTADMRNDLRCWYLGYAGRYSAAILSLVFLEKGRKDSKEMLLHHLITVFIVLASYNIGFYRVGAVVQLLMDPADVFLHAAKLSKYCNHTFLADRLFEAFAVSFFVTRLIMYGYVVWASVFEVREYTVLPMSGNACVVGLVVLYGLNAWWFSLVIKVAVKIARGGNAEDIREGVGKED